MGTEWRSTAPPSSCPPVPIQLSLCLDVSQCFFLSLFLYLALFFLLPIFLSIFLSRALYCTLSVSEGEGWRSTALPSPGTPVPRLQIVSNFSVRFLSIYLSPSFSVCLSLFLSRSIYRYVSSLSLSLALSLALSRALRERGRGRGMTQHRTAILFKPPTLTLNHQTPTLRTFQPKPSQCTPNPREPHALNP